MYRTLSACAALAAVAVFAQAMPSSAPAPAPAGGPCPNIFAVEPLVMYDVSGFGLGGPIHRHLAVYNNGLASFSKSSNIQGNNDGTVRFEYLPVAEAFQLARDLYDAGAWDVCDEFLPVADLPLTTVTLLRGATNAPSHTYSYFYPDSQPAQDAAVILSTFITEHFPDR